MSGKIIPLSLNQTLGWKVRNFPDDVYGFNTQDKLTILMSILLGQAGTGQLISAQIAAKLNQQNMEFSDLDNILGQILNAPRLVSEIYSLSTNPFIDQLTRSTWQDVVTKDSDYRERLIGIASSFLKGGTVFGIQRIAEATSSFQFRVIEAWQTVASGSVVPTVIASGVTSRGFASNEVLLVPNVPSDLQFSTDIRHQTLMSLNNLKPAGSIVTVTSGINGFGSAMKYAVVSGNSQFFSFDRTVTANNINQPANSYNINDISYAGRYWLQNSQTVLAPNFAHLQSQEGSIDLTENISTVFITPTTTYSGVPQFATLPTYSTNDPLGAPTLSITSTIYGAQ